MNFSKTKIGAFFIALLLLGWFLYPRELFLGYIFEGQAEFDKSAQYYTRYLLRRPHDKFATLRLAHLYDRVGQPEKSINLLKELYQHRPTDWAVATEYLNILEEVHSDEALYRARLEVVENMKKIPGFKKRDLEDLLSAAYSYASWKQRPEEMYAILKQLIGLSSNPKTYLTDLMNLDWSFKKSNKILAELTQQLMANPEDEGTRSELISVEMVLGNVDKALELVDEGIKRNPKNPAFYKMRIFVDEKRKDSKQAILDHERMLGLQILPVEEERAALRSLAYYYQKDGRLLEAKSVYAKLVRGDTSDRESWLNLIYLEADKGNLDTAIGYLKEYLHFFPDDAERQKYLVNLYLYEKKEVGRLDFYRDYVARTLKSQLAQDVAYLLLEKGRNEQADDWVMQMKKIFPNDAKMADLTMEVLSRQGLYDQAVQEGQAFLGAHPGNSDVVYALGKTYAQASEPEKASRYLKEYAGMKQNDPQALTDAGRELYSLGLHEEARKNLERSLELKQDNPETWFWLSEVAQATGSTDIAKNMASRALTLLAAQHKTSLEMTRMELKTRGRLNYDDAIVSDYVAAQKKSLSNSIFFTDLIDLQLEQQDYLSARQSLVAYQKHFPKEKDRVRDYVIQMELAQKHWTAALPFMEAKLKTKPKQWLVMRDVADISLKAGKWKRAREIYDSIPPAVAKKIKTAQAQKAVHDRYDTRVTKGFVFKDFGTDSAKEWELDMHSFVSDKFDLAVKARLGDYDSVASNFHDQAWSGLLSGTWVKDPQTQLTAGVGYGFSPARKTASPFGEARFAPMDNVQLGLGINYRELRLDTPRAVGEGALWDRYHFQWNVSLLQHFAFSGRYEYQHNYLTGGPKSDGHLLEPALLYTFSGERKVVTIGYQFSFFDLTRDAAFTARLPLVNRIEAHYLTADMSAPLHLGGNNLWGEVGGFIGEDTARHLHVSQGDLWGAHVALKWVVNTWLDFKAVYDYGKENLNSVSGQSNQFYFTLSGHWY